MVELNFDISDELEQKAQDVLSHVNKNPPANKPFADTDSLFRFWLREYQGKALENITKWKEKRWPNIEPFMWPRSDGHKCNGKHYKIVIGKLSHAGWLEIVPFENGLKRMNAEGSNVQPRYFTCPDELACDIIIDKVAEAYKAMLTEALKKEDEEIENPGPSSTK